MPSFNAINWNQCEQADRAAHQRKGHHHEHRDGAAWQGDDGLQATTTFDFDEVDKDLGWEDPEDRVEREHSEPFKRAADILGKLVAWLAEAGTVEAAGRRAVCLVNFIRPDLLGNQTLRRLAVSWGAGTAQSISTYSKQLVAMCGENFRTGTTATLQTRRLYRVGHLGKSRLGKPQPKGQKVQTIRRMR